MDGNVASDAMLRRCGGRCEDGVHHDAGEDDWAFFRDARISPLQLRKPMLYRGEDLDVHENNNGAILPKGGLVEVVPLADGSIRADGKFNYGPSEENAARAQQIDGGKWGTCFVSTTRSREQACKFATSSNLKEGVIYWIDEGLFEEHGVVFREFRDSLYP